MQAKIFNRYQQKAFDRYAKARKTDLRGLIEDRYNIKFSGKGNYLDAHGHGLRLSYKPDQELWLSAGKTKGDAIQTIKELEKIYNNKEISINDAIQIIEDYELTNKNTTIKQSESKSVETKDTDFKFTMPTISKNTDELFDYITNVRGISNTTINKAIANGFCERHKDGLMFVNRNEQGVAVGAEIRLMKHRMFDGKEVKFISIKGSDRSFPPVFPGQDKSTVHIVEGGFSALALHEILSRDNKNQTIIVSGGRDNHQFLKHQHIQEMLKSADVVIVHAENERTEKIQMESDQSLSSLCEKIFQVTHKQIQIQKPPYGLKDNADVNLAYKREKLSSSMNESQKFK